MVTESRIMLNTPDNTTPDQPNNWEKYGGLLRELPPKELPDGSLARLNARFYRERRRVRSFRWFLMPSLSLATVLLALWVGGNQVNHKAAAPPTKPMAVGTKNPSRSLASRRIRTGLPMAVKSTEPATGSLKSSHDSESRLDVAANRATDSAASAAPRVPQSRESEAFGRSALAYYPGGAVPAPLQ
jgi:hypothetical protein